MPRDRSRLLFVLVGTLVVAAVIVLWRSGGTTTDRAPMRPPLDPTDTRSQPSDVRAPERPRADDDTPESKPETRPDGRLHVAFVDEDDAPVNGFAAVYFEDEKLIHGMWEAGGGASFDAVRLPASVVVAPYDRDPSVAALLAGSGHVTVRLPRGAVVSGKAFVNGSIPATQLELRLRANPPRRFRDSWPPAVDRWMHLVRPETPDLRGWTDLRDGTFRFSGLHSEWNGALLIPNGYRMEGVTDQEIPIGQPTSGIVLNLIELPHIRGRVVSAKTRAPVNGAAISLTVVGKNGARSGAGGLFSDGKGRFAIPVPGGGTWTSGVLDIFNLQDSGVRHMTISEADLAQGRDLGEVEVEAPRAMHLRIQSKAGLPIESARVLAKTPPDLLRYLARSGKDGKVAFAVPPSASGLRVVASGFEPVELAVPADDSEVEVMLARGTRLTIRVVLADGVTDAQAVSLWLQSDHQILRPSAKSERDWVQRAPPDYDVTVWDSPEDGTRVDLGDPPATLSCLWPGRAFDVRARDLLTETTASQSVVLAEEEWKAVVLTLPLAPRRLEGKVVDSAGEPLYQAQVLLQSGGMTVGLKETGRDGGFLFDRLTLDRVQASVEMPGFSRWSQDVALSTDGVRLSIQLARADALTISVVDGRGNPVEGAMLSIPALSTMSRLRTNARGQVTLSSPPQGEFVVSAQFGPVTATESHRASVQGVVIRLPPYGTVDVTVAAAIAPAGSQVELSPVAPGGAPVWQSMVLDAAGHAVARGIPVGTYQVRLIPPGKAATAVAGPTIEVKNGETTSAVLEGPR